jgi:hypothetical protein
MPAYHAGGGGGNAVSRGLPVPTAGDLAAVALQQVRRTVATSVGQPSTNHGQINGATGHDENSINISQSSGMNHRAFSNNFPHREVNNVIHNPTIQDQHVSDGMVEDNRTEAQPIQQNGSNRKKCSDSDSSHEDATKKLPGRDCASDSDDDDSDDELEEKFEKLVSNSGR